MDAQAEANPKFSLSSKAIAACGIGQFLPSS
jgi:hypothetical protein